MAAQRETSHAIVCDIGGVLTAPPVHAAAEYLAGHIFRAAREAGMYAIHFTDTAAAEAIDRCLDLLSERA